MQENRELTEKGFGILQPVLSDYIIRIFREAYGSGWRQEIREALEAQGDSPASASGPEGAGALSLESCLRILDRRWGDLFCEMLSRDSRTWARELMCVRERSAQLTDPEDLNRMEAWRALDTMARLCVLLGAERRKTELLTLCRRVLYGPEGAASEERKREQEYCELAEEGSAVLEPVLAGCVGQAFSAEYGENWWQEVRKALPGAEDLPSSGPYAELVDSLGLVQCLSLISRRWEDVFCSRLGSSSRAWAGELLDLSGRISRSGSGAFENRETAVKALDAMAGLGAEVDEDCGEELRELYLTARFGKGEREEYELIVKGFRILEPALAGWICRVFRSGYGEMRWWDEIRDALPDRKEIPRTGTDPELEDSLDLDSCLLLLDRRWEDLFRSRLSPDCGAWVREVKDAWEEIRSGSEALDWGYAYRALEAMAGLCGEMDEDSTEKLRELCRIARHGQRAAAAEKKG